MATYNSPPPSGNDVAGSAFFKKFLAAAESYISQPSRLKKLLVDSFNKAREKKEIGTLAHEAWDTLQSLFRLIKLSASGEYTGVPTSTVVAAVAVLIYFLSPIDLIPDIIPVIGLLDDMALVAWFSSSIKHELDKFHEWEAAKAATLVSDDELTKTGASDVTKSLKLEPWETRSAGSTNQSAKSAGTTNLPTAPTGTQQSATDAGLGSPSSSTTRPIHDRGADMGSDDRRTSDAAANTTDGSRHPFGGQEATGGNVR